MAAGAAAERSPSGLEPCLRGGRAASRRSPTDRAVRLVLTHEAGVADHFGVEDRGGAAGGGHSLGSPALRRPSAKRATSCLWIGLSLNLAPNSIIALAVSSGFSLRRFANATPIGIFPAVLCEGRLFRVFAMRLANEHAGVPFLLIGDLNTGDNSLARATR